MVFLYKILGWSAFVGFASIIALIPLPGYIASLIQRVQKKKMVMVSAPLSHFYPVIEVDDTFDRSTLESRQ
jgi:hypothetical protein